MRGKEHIKENWAVVVKKSTFKQKKIAYCESNLYVEFFVKNIEVYKREIIFYVFSHSGNLTIWKNWTIGDVPLDKK